MNSSETDHPEVSIGYVDPRYGPEPEPDADCVFCQIVRGESPARFIERTSETCVFRPLGEQVPGHVLVVPTKHVSDATEDLHVSALTLLYAAEYAKRLARPANIITSIGAEATQSVFHLHVHVLPRGDSDGLRRSWPWVRSKPVTS